MKKYLASLVSFLISFFIFSHAQASPEADAIRVVDDAHVIVLTVCNYVLILRQYDSVQMVFKSPRFGNGFFIEHAMDNIVATAGHVVTCDDEPDEEFYADEIKREDVTLLGVTASVYVFYDDERYAADILSNLFVDNADDADSPDMAFLKANLPEEISHYSVPVLSDSNQYDLLSPVVIRGAMSYDGQWLMRLMRARIESINDNTVQLNTALYPGLSGSMGLFWHTDKQKYFAILVVTTASYNENYGIINVSWATMIKKEYLDSLTETASD